MNYYKRHIGDYYRKAGRLTMLQHGAYTLLMDACYDRERFPTEEEAIEWCWASTDEEIAAVKFVLHKFFTDKDGVFSQKRIDEEVTGYKGKCETNRAIAVEREKRRATKRAENSTKRVQGVDEAPPNHKPLTNNQEKKTKQKKKPSAGVERPSDVEVQVWDDFLSHRKRLRADLTPTAMTRIKNEAKKAGIPLNDVLTEMVARGWRGFDADWVKKDENQKTAKQEQIQWV